MCLADSWLLFVITVLTLIGISSTVVIAAKLLEVSETVTHLAAATAQLANVVNRCKIRVAHSEQRGPATTPTESVV